MQAWKRWAAGLLMALMLLPPGLAFAAGEEPSSGLGQENAQLAQGDMTEKTPAAEKKAVARNEALCRQIRDTYTAAKKRSRRSSFKGYCGAYVANQLVVLGINEKYLSANGKNTYDIYRRLDITTGGYAVTAYGAKSYTLSQALTAILKKNPSPRNILVGFQKGTSSSGKKYGHTLFIHGIENGYVYYSDSSSRTVDGVKYKEGEPIVCTLAAFAEQYAKYRLDGVVHFVKKTVPVAKTAEPTETERESTLQTVEQAPEEPPLAEQAAETMPLQPSSSEDTASVREEKESAEG